jgi:hypothetical protein
MPFSNHPVSPGHIPFSRDALPRWTAQFFVLVRVHLCFGVIILSKWLRSGFDGFPPLPFLGREKFPFVTQWFRASVRGSGFCWSPNGVVTLWDMLVVPWWFLTTHIWCFLLALGEAWQTSWLIVSGLD